jgi:hypothetical protein
MESEGAMKTPARYNIPWGSGDFNFSAGLRGVYVDNVFLTHAGACSMSSNSLILS